MRPSLSQGKVGGSIPPLATRSELHGHCDDTRWLILCVRFRSVRRGRVGCVEPVEVSCNLVEFVGIQVSEYRSL